MNHPKANLVLECIALGETQFNFLDIEISFEFAIEMFRHP